MKLKHKSIIPLLLLTCSLNTKAHVKLSVLFQSYMVLPRDKPCNVWRTADDNEAISISFNNATYNTTGANGKWKITLPVQAAGDRFYRAKGFVRKDNSIVVYNPIIKSPISVRYLCSSNPGDVDLYN